MASERCLPVCADTQTGLPAATKALWSMDRDSTGQARSWLRGVPPPVLSRHAGPYRRGENANTVRHDSQYGWLSRRKKLPTPDPAPSNFTNCPPAADLPDSDVCEKKVKRAHS